MIYRLSTSELESVLAVINDAAQSFKDVIPEDRWQEPYMPRRELKSEVESGVEFYGWVEKNELVAVMGIQFVSDITLIRHAYVKKGYQRQGIGEKLLRHLLSLTRTSVVLVGTWEAAYWAIRFYEKHGFNLLSKEETGKLLRKYWNIPERQTETSVVLKLTDPRAQVANNT